MASTRKPIPQKIQIPAVYVWAAGQMAKAQGRHTELEQVRTIFQASLTKIQKASTYTLPREVNFSRKVKSALHQGVIPFVRDDLDLSLAMFVFGEGAEFLLRSEKSRVDCGFLRVSQKEIVYVDFVHDMIRADSHIAEFLSESDKADLLLTLDSLATTPTFFESATGEDHLLKISGKPDLFSAIGGKISCSISLWKGPQPGQGAPGMGSLNRNLGQASLHRNGNALYLQELSAQVTLELTAASLMGQWLLIESEEFKAFGALPDLTTDGEQLKVAVDPIPLLKKFTLNETPQVYADPDVVRHFSRMYPWFVPGDSKTWLASIQL